MDKKEAKLQDKINKLKAELIELRAERKYWKRQKALAMRKKGDTEHGHQKDD